MASGKNMADSGRVLVVVPAYGHHEMTHDLVGDLTRESNLADIVVVDNEGDYQVISAEDVVRPASNLGWAGGTNLGTLERRGPEHVEVVSLSDNTRLSVEYMSD